LICRSLLRHYGYPSTPTTETTSSEITSAIATVGFESNNGYDLLWRILELTVLGFDPTVPILPPTLYRDSDMFDFCQAHLLYFPLQAKKNKYFDARTRTSIFLRAIADSKYTDIVTLLQAQVNSFHDTGNDGYLPHHLRLSSITTLINANTKARVQDFVSPRINKAFGSGYEWDTASGSGYDWDAVDKEELPYCHVQGYTPRVHRLDQGRDRADTGRDRDRDRDRDRYPGANRGHREPDLRRDFGTRDCGRARPGACGPQGAAPYARINAADPSFQVSSALHASIPDTRLQTATCSQLRFLWTTIRIGFRRT